MSEHTCILASQAQATIGTCAACEADHEQQEQRRRTLVTEIRRAINFASFEQYSNTPDFVLAEVAVQAIEAFGRGVVERDQWYGERRKPTP